MSLHGANQREQQSLAPVGKTWTREYTRQPLADDGGRVLIQRGEEQRLFVSELGVRVGAADGGVSRDIRDRGGSIPLAAEPGDGGVEDGLPRLGAFSRQRIG
jgi:hypothetical protein